jgi:hypothetical protein
LRLRRVGGLGVGQRLREDRVRRKLDWLSKTYDPPLVGTGAVDGYLCTRTTRLIASAVQPSRSSSTTRAPTLSLTAKVVCERLLSCLWATGHHTKRLGSRSRSATRECGAAGVTVTERPLHVGRTRTVRATTRSYRVSLVS